MKVLLLLASLVCIASLHAESGAYHTTGPVVSFDEKTVTIQHGKARWTFDRGVELSGPLTVGSTVTINYHMVADSVTPADPKEAPPTPPAGTKTREKTSPSKTKGKTPEASSKTKTPAKSNSKTPSKPAPKKPAKPSDQ